MRERYRKACATRVDGPFAANSARSGRAVHRAVCSPRPAVPSRQGKKEGPANGSLVRRSDARAGYALVAGLTPGLSLKNCLFISM